MVVEARLLVIDVAPVTEGLICAYRVCQAARCGNDLAPTVIYIFYNSVSAAVNELDNIAVMTLIKAGMIRFHALHTLLQNQNPQPL